MLSRLAAAMAMLIILAVPTGAQAPANVEWYVGENGRPVGPLTLDMLLEGIRTGNLTSNDLVWFTGAPDWAAAGTIPELTAAFAPRQLPPPLPSPQPPPLPAAKGFQVGQPAPELTLSPVPGLDAALAPPPGRLDFNGRVTIVKLWASWNAPSHSELPELVELLVPYPDVFVVGVAWSDIDTSVAAFISERSTPFDIVGSLTPDREDTLGVRGIPETFIIDAEGIVRFESIGPVVAADFLAALDELR